MKGSDPADLGPLPEVNPRDVPARKAALDLDAAVEAIRLRHSLTSAELLDTLASVLHNRTRLILSCERRASE